MADKAGRWLRVSTAGQDEQSQVPEVDAWCEARSYTLSDETTYVIHGKSAFKGNPTFDRMWQRVLSDFRAGRIHVLVVWKQDRLDRKLNTFQMLAQVVEAGGRVEFVTQPHLNDLTTMGGRIALKVQEEIAYAESKDKSDRIRISHAGLRQRGSVIARAPYGFRISGVKGNKALVPFPSEAEVIRQAAKWYLSGLSLDDICDRLNLNGDLPHEWRNGKQPLWCVKSLSKLLRNPALVGRRRNGEGWVVKCDPILTREVYDAVVRRMDERAQRKGISQAKSPAMLTSVIRCGRHGAMYRCGAPSARGYYCRVKGCDSFILVAEADAWVDARMRGLDRRDVVEVVTPGGNHDDAIAEVKADMQDALTREDFGKLAELQTELQRLRSLPAKRATVERRESDKTVAEQWQGLADDTERRGFLLERKAVVTVERNDAGGWRLTFDAPFVRLS